MTQAPLSQILQIIHLAEGLKNELRHSWTSTGRRESVAEHTWRASLMTLLLAPYLEDPVNLGRALEMIIVHDLVEALARDIPVFDSQSPEARQVKHEKEIAAIERIRNILGDQTGDHIAALWYEFENGTSAEARLGHAVDKIEAQIQHNEACLSTWIEWEKERLFSGRLEEYCSHSDFLTSFVREVVREGVNKLQQAGKPLVRYGSD